MSQTKVVHLIITNLIRLTLFLTFIYATTSSRTLIQTVAGIALLTTFIPTILDKVFRVRIPASFEIIYLMGIYGLLILGELRGFYHGTFWWSFIMTFTASLALGFTSISMVHVLHKTSRISPSPVLAAILIFAITLCLATLWEIFEFMLDTIIHSGLQASLVDTMQDLSINMLGAFIVAIAGNNSIKRGSMILTSTFLTDLIERNSKLFGPKLKTYNPQRVASDIILIGETPKIEFKSTLRTNLHTKAYDKKMELSVLKTIVAFLNSTGGNLLVGVDDDRKILGLEKDNFQNEDKAALHLTNLIRSHIGNEFLPFIRSAVVTLQDKKVLLVVCAKSRKRVFLKDGNREEFYVRNGPASVKLEGGALIDYVEHRFG